MELDQKRPNLVIMERTDRDTPIMRRIMAQIGNSALQPQPVAEQLLSASEPGGVPRLPMRQPIGAGFDGPRAA